MYLFLFIESLFAYEGGKGKLHDPLLNATGQDLWPVPFENTKKQHLTLNVTLYLLQRNGGDP